MIRTMDKDLGQGTKAMEKDIRSLPINKDKNKTKRAVQEKDQNQGLRTGTLVQPTQRRDNPFKNALKFKYSFPLIAVGRSGLYRRQWGIGLSFSYNIQYTNEKRTGIKRR